MVREEREQEVVPLPAKRAGIPEIRSSSVIRRELDRWVVGQEEAKIVLSTIAHRNYMRVVHRLSGDEASASVIPKQNVLILGPTGCGKTLLVRKLAEVLGVPHIIASAASFTEDGYQGDSVNDVFRMLMVRSGGDGSERWGMICFDEIDKKARRETGNHRDISGMSVQQAMLNQLDPKGNIIDVAGPKHGQRLVVDTSDIFFLLAGAFSDGLREIVERRIGGRRTMGFASNNGSDPVRAGGVLEVTDADVEAYGFIPEFCSRIGHVVVLGELGSDDLRRVLLDVEDAPIRSAIAVAAQYGFILKFDESAVEAIISEAISTGYGARKLASIVDRAVLQVLYEVPERVARRKTTPIVTITERTIEDPSSFHVR
jgi:ATP-dependent Clp protease ATP-binding subunit ClpX